MLNICEATKIAVIQVIKANIGYKIHGSDCLAGVTANTIYTDL